MAMANEKAIWEQIELSESYLVCSMYEEALSLASSILQHTSQINNTYQKDMSEAAGMVLVQSMKELGRTSHIVDELKISFASVAAIPVEVLLTGACFQILEDSSHIGCFLEEFLSKWSLLNEENYVLVGSESYISDVENCDGHAQLSVDEYIQVVEVYLQTLIEGLNDVDLAVSWVEKAALPKEKRQVLLRRLDYLCSLKAANLSKSSALLKDDHRANLSSPEELEVSRGSKAAVDPVYLQDGGSANGEKVLRISKLTEPTYWWFRTITLKFGSAQLVISNRRIVLICLSVLIYNLLLRRRKTTLKRSIQRVASSTKKALLDLWQLAFSYQVIPLAIAQPLSAAARGGQ